MSFLCLSVSLSLCLSASLYPPIQALILSPSFLKETAAFWFSAAVFEASAHSSLPTLSPFLLSCKQGPLALSSQPFLLYRKPLSLRNDVKLFCLVVGLLFRRVTSEKAQNIGANRAVTVPDNLYFSEKPSVSL